MGEPIGRGVGFLTGMGVALLEAGKPETQYIGTDRGALDSNVRRMPSWLPRWREVARYFLASDLLIGLVLAMLAWPYDSASLMATSGFDPSWMASLEMAAHERLAFGTHFVFAYGPLGFLAVWPIYYTWLAIVGFLFFLALYTATFAVLVWALRRALPLVLAVVLAFVAGTISINVVALLWTGEPEKALALTLVACVYILSRPVDSPVSPRLWVVLGIALAIFGLIKLSVGFGMVIALVVTVACLPAHRRRALGGLALGLIPTGAIAWFATGNGFGNIDAFVRGSISIVGGYGAAVSIEDPTRWYTYWLALAVVVLVAGLAVAFSWRLPRRAQVGIGLATLVILWQLFKEGFVRHDLYHDPVFFTAATILVVAFVPPRRRWASSDTGAATGSGRGRHSAPRRSVLALAAAAAVLATAIVAGEVGGFPSELTRPGTAVGDFANELTTLVSPGKRAGEIDTARSGLQAGYQVPASMLADMSGQTVDVDPWEEAVVWAYPSVRFDPLPGVQDYSTYTDSLDQLDVRYIASDQAPRYILRQVPAAPDGRDPIFDPPATQIAIECNYRQVQSTASWQLLVRSTDRCGAPRPIGSAQVGWGETVQVPAAGPDNAVVATFQLPLSLWWKVQDEVFKPPQISMTADGSPVPYRFVGGSASDLHLLVPAASLGYDPAFTPDSITTLSFAMDDQGITTSGIVVRFYALPMLPFGG